jgi:hypothetical protein
VQQTMARINKIFFASIILKSATKIK